MEDRRFTQRHAQLRRRIDIRLASLVRSSISPPLVAGCEHVLLTGGKRARALLVLMAAEAVGGRVEDALAASAAVEILHNFTLVHDDIMDHAPSRRGKPTVHVRWDVNYALLVGDVLVGLAYRSLLTSESPQLPHMSRVFTEGLLEVCDGQALDLGDGRRPRTGMRAYFSMIEKKTARLFAVATELGALAGGGTAPKARALRSFGHYLGRAFQVQDDLLDITARQHELGKAIGGDIRERKKTYLWLSALERTAGSDRQALLRVMDPRARISRRTVSHVARIYQTCGAIDRARMQIHRDTEKATAALRSVGTNEATAMLRWFSERLLHRVS